MVSVNFKGSSRRSGIGIQIPSNIQCGLLRVVGWARWCHTWQCWEEEPDKLQWVHILAMAYGTTTQRCFVTHYDIIRDLIE